MNTHLVFSDETENFRIPAEPKAGEPFLLRLWADRNAQLSVSLVIKSETETLSLPLERCGERGAYAVYETKVPGVQHRAAYYFLLEGEGQFLFYGRGGLAEDVKDVVPFTVLPEFHVPGWARGAVWYQIYPDRFCNGDPENDVTDGEIHDDVDLISRHREWYTPVEPMEVNHYYGGDLQGIIKRLDYLSSLGVEVLYLNPVFVAPSNHKYNTQDYLHVDPHLGKIVNDTAGPDRYRLRTTDPENLAASDALLAELIEKAHACGMKVVLDGVFNHCSSFHKWMNIARLYEENGVPVGAKWDECSEYAGYFRRDKEFGHECWWGNKNLLKLNVDGSGALRQELLSVARKWVSAPYGADGWRLDVAADVAHTPEANHEFWKEFRETVRAANPEAVLLAEHYGDPAPWLQGEEWDSVMNYDAFMDPVTWFLTGMDKHSDRYEAGMDGNGEIFRDAMLRAMARFPQASLECALNELDNHDHSRFLTRTNRLAGRLGSCTPEQAEEGISVSLFREAIVMQMTWPGAPGIYYGDEVGLCGFTDPDNRRPFPWGIGDAEIFDFYQNAIRLHRKYPAIYSGSLRILQAEEGLLVYGRFLKDDHLLVCINQKETHQNLRLDTSGLDGLPADTLIRVLQTHEDGYNCGNMKQETWGGVLYLRMEPHEASVFIW